MRLISELFDGERVNSQFLINSCVKGTNANGAQYLNIELKDCSGTINAKKWEIGPNDESFAIVGNIVNIVGEVLKYKDNLQIKILSISPVNNEDVKIERFIKQPPVPKEELVNRLNEYIEDIENEDCKRIVKNIVSLVSPKIYSYPAAVSIHHDYMSGLLMHTVTMLDIAKFLYPIYEADKNLLYSGIILHDLGKTIELEGPVVYKYSLEGKLIGHISIMSAIIKESATKLSIENETPLLLQHMILSHHGQHEYGSPVLPLTKEAVLLSLIDNLDCKLVALNKALETVQEGEFTQKIYSLDGRSFYKKK